MAKEPSESWMIQAETIEPHPDDATMTIETTYWTHVPLCEKCHGQLTRLGYLFWFVGIMGGAVAAGLVAHFAPQYIHRDANIPMALNILALVAVVGGVAWGIAWACKKFISCCLATYKPRQARITFGNKEYQALFDEANRYMPDYSKKCKLGV
ncbi:MAG: hypothetical protein L0211_15100 [Planctomycetaceae bacterium]|nr:hypothetical protein [Planctomycetaceae bacterium]